MKPRQLLLLVIACIVFLLGGMYSAINRTIPYTWIRDFKDHALTIKTPWSAVAVSTYDERFKTVSTSSSSDLVNAYSYTASDVAPLVVSLHTWVDDWTEQDNLAPLIADLDWNYIHPGFQGPEYSPDACLSDTVISEIDTAIRWAIEQGNVDTDNIFVVGASGGGYTALGYRLKTDIRIKHTHAWVPITDLEDWYYQSSNRGLVYADEIKACLGGELAISEAKKRSPYNLAEKANGHVTLFAGLNDGYTGTVPITHSFKYFNKLAKPVDRVSVETQMDIVSKGVGSAVGLLGNRAVYFDRQSDLARVVIFDGGHEILPEAALSEIVNTLNTNN